MTIHAKYVHTNLIARDWKRLSTFYERVFGCIPVPPARDLSGEWLDAATGIPRAQIQGMHLRLPGYGEEGPTLEIFQYNRQVEQPRPAVNRPGFAHIAFAVDDVAATRNAVLAAGGGTVGELVFVEIHGVGQITFAYVTDPEGNIIELQRWSD